MIFHPKRRNSLPWLILDAMASLAVILLLWLWLILRKGN